MGRQEPRGCILRNVPLMGQYDTGDGIHLDAPQAFAVDATQALRDSIRVPPQQAMQDGYEYPTYEEHRDEEYEQTSHTIQWSNGGMPVDHNYTKSMYTEGVKWYDNDTGKLYLATSTADSNRRSSMTRGLPYLAMQIWVSEAHMHNKQGGKGMDSMPLMNQCRCIGTAADFFQEITWNEVSCIAFWYYF